MKSRFKYIAIEGNIGAGKTTLATHLKDLMNGKLLLERFEENPHLEDFYKDKEKFALETENFFLNDRIQQLERHFNQSDSLTISDFSIFKTLVFSKITLSEDHWQFFFKTFEASTRNLPRPDLIIYLKTDTNRVMQQILKRGRPYEQDMDLGYLHMLQEAYDLYWKTNSFLNVLEIPAHNLNYPYSNEQLRKLRNYIESSEIKGFMSLEEGLV